MRCLIKIINNGIINLFQKQEEKEMKWKIEVGELVFYDEKGEKIPHTSIDEKPIEGVPNGIMVHEEDTDDLYAFDEDMKCWVKMFDF